MLCEPCCLPAVRLRHLQGPEEPTHCWSQLQTAPDLLACRSPEGPAGGAEGGRPVSHCRLPGQPLPLLTRGGLEGAPAQQAGCRAARSTVPASAAAPTSRRRDGGRLPVSHSGCSVQTVWEAHQMAGCCSHVYTAVCKRLCCVAAQCGCS